MSQEEALERARIYTKCMEHAGVFIAIMQANGADPRDIACIGSLMTSHQFPHVLPGSEDEYLQMNVNLVVHAGPEVDQHARIMLDAMRHVPVSDVLDVVLDRWAKKA